MRDQREGFEYGAEGQNPERGYCLLLDSASYPYFVRCYAILRLIKIGPL